MGAGPRQLGFWGGFLPVGEEVVGGGFPTPTGVGWPERLMRRGFWPRLVIAVPDDPPLIVRQLRIAADTADLVVVSGGLGWTPDDVTRSAVAEAFYRDLAVDRERARQFESASPWAAGEIANAACTFPSEAEALESPLGGVPGFVLRNVYVLPGAPDEMRAMFDAIDFHRTTNEIHSLSVTCSLEEHRITEMLQRFDELHGDVRLGSYPQVGASPPVLTLTLTSRDPSAVHRAAQWVRLEIDRID